MKFKSVILILLVAIIVPNLSAQTNVERINSLLEYTGIERQLEDIFPMQEQIFGTQKNSFNDEQFNFIMEIIQKEFSQISLIDTIRNQFIKNYNEQFLVSIEKVYKTSLFKRITAAEILNSSSEKSEEQSNFDYSKVKKNRMELIDSFIEKSRMLELAESVAKNIYLSFFKTINLFLPAENKISDSIIASSLDSIIPAIFNDDFIQNLRQKNAFIYEEFTDSELTEYFNFYQSEYGKWTMNNLMTGVEKAFSSAMDSVAIEIINKFGSPEHGTL